MESMSAIQFRDLVMVIRGDSYNFEQNFDIEERFRDTTETVIEGMVRAKGGSLHRKGRKMLESGL